MGGVVREVIAFACEGETLLATLDRVPGKGPHRSNGSMGPEAGTQPGPPPSGEHDVATALLIVSGGNEVRAGAHRGMAMLAQRIAAGGVPVLRFDRRGVGDSSGTNEGFRASAPDIAAAARLLRETTGATRLVGFGNCDAASALALFGRAAGLDALILANPWVVEPPDDLPPPAAIRARYADRLRDPAAWRRLLTGGVSLLRAARGLARIVRPAPPAALAREVLAAIAAWGDDAALILASRDATALAYDDAAGGGGPRATVRLDTASHSFADVQDALAAAIIAAIAGPVERGRSH